MTDTPSNDTPLKKTHPPWQHEYRLPTVSTPGSMSCSLRIRTSLRQIDVRQQVPRCVFGIGDGSLPEFGGEGGQHVWRAGR